MRRIQQYLAFLAVLLVTASLFAQGTTGTLTGTVTNDGSPLPGATISISSPSLQGVRTSTTDINGNYNFGALPPGDYTVKAELSGMQTVTKTAHVALSQAARVDADLKLSSVAQTITVTAASPVTAALESTEVQTNLQHKTLSQLPVRRDIVNVGNLAPGVTGNTPSGGQLAISGAPASENLYLVNGAVVNENVRSQVHNLFIEEAIQETTVQTAGISAEYGRFTGGVVSAITKSGGNEFSGSIRDDAENDSWSAKSAYANQPERLDSVRHTYSGTLGGRIVRDRLWFFLASRYFNTSQQAFLTATEDDPSTPSFTFGQKNMRWEGKLTAQLTQRHSLQGSYLSNNTEQTNNCFVSCYEVSNIDASRELPNDFITAHYNGILTSNWLVEAGYSKKTFQFKGSGGDFSDPVHGTWGYDLNTGAFFGAPVFCGFCDPEKRDNHDLTLKSTYYLATKALGSHNFVAGIDDFAEQRKSNNYQSGSNFEIYTYNSPTRAANGDLLVTITNGDYIQYTPILQLSKGSNIGTKSLFLNDKWDLNNHLNFNVGVRYDKNDVADSSGRKTANDSKVSPRLGITFDPMGNGKVRFNANYSTYVSHIQESIGGSGASGAGNPAYVAYTYEGPDVVSLPTAQAFTQVFNWFNSVGGINNSSLIQSAGYPGLNTVIRDPLTSPSVDEWTLGAGAQVGSNGYVRGDYINRSFHDFYGLFSSGEKTHDPAGNAIDVSVINNSSTLRRDYKAAIFQANYRFTDRFNMGGNFTWSTTKGNFRGETSGSGPVTDASTQYPEFKAFANNNPYGYIDNVDEKYKGRLFATYDLPTPVGSFTVGLLERYDTGTPYSAIGTLNPQPYVSADIKSKYVTPPTSVNYYFSKRGQYRFDTVTATDLSLTYTLPVSKLNFWVKGDLINSFNEQAQVFGSTSIRTAANNANFVRFNPFTDTPKECPQGTAGAQCKAMGANWQKSPTFGTARSANDYQQPRTYRLAVGVRF